MSTLLTLIHGLYNSFQKIFQILVTFLGIEIPNFSQTFTNINFHECNLSLINLPINFFVGFIFEDVFLFLLFIVLILFYSIYLLSLVGLRVSKEEKLDVAISAAIVVLFTLGFISIFITLQIFNSFVIDLSSFSILTVQSIVIFLGAFALLNARASIVESGLSLFYSLFILSTILGAIGITSGRDWVFILLSIELMTMSFYFLVAANINSINSLEAAIKYFIIGSVATMVLLYGIWLLYFSLGALDLTFSQYFLANTQEIFLMKTSSFYRIVTVDLSLVEIYIENAIFLILLSLTLKLGAAPFHFWVVDVYENAPTSTTLFLILIPKFVIFTFLNSLIYVIFTNFSDLVQNYLVFVGALSIVIGSLSAFRQTKIKRLLIFSSINDTGFLFLGLSVGTLRGLESLLVYMLVYLLINLILWSFLIFFERDSKIKELTLVDLASYPSFGIYFILLVGSLAGIPPLLGFWSKWAILFTLVSVKLVFFFFLILISILVSTFYYLKIINSIFIENSNIKVREDFVKTNFLNLFILSFIILFFTLDPELCFLFFRFIAIGFQFF